MAVSITETPQAVELTRNQAVFKLNTDRYPQQQGANNLLAIQLSNAPTDEDNMLLTFFVDGEPQYAYFAFTTDTPNDSGTQVEAFVAGTLADYTLNTFYPAVAGHPVISEYFQVYYDTDLNIIALYSFSQEEHNLTAVANGFTLLQISLNAGAEFTSLQEYTMKYRVFMLTPNSLLGETSPYHTVLPDTDGNASIDVAPILHDLLTEIDPIHSILTDFYLNEYTCRTYYLEATESWIPDTNSNAIKVTKLLNRVERSAEFKCIKGAEPVRLFSGSQFINRSTLWLGLQGLTRYLSFNSTAIASMYLPGTDIVGGLELEAQVTDHSGTTTTISALVSGVGIEFNSKELVSMPIGYTALGLDGTVATEEVSYYRLVLKFDGNPIFSILKIYPEQAKVFHRELRYRGAHGTAQTLMLTGEATETAAVEKTTLETHRALSLTANSRTTSTINKTGAHTLTIGTGPLPASYKYAIWEILHSPELYIMEGTTATPVSLLNKEEITLQLNRAANNLLSTTLELAFNTDRT